MKNSIEENIIKMSAKQTNSSNSNEHQVFDRDYDWLLEFQIDRNPWIELSDQQSIIQLSIGCW